MKISITTLIEGYKLYIQIHSICFTFRPRVHAQRKFAQGQGQSPCSSVHGSPAKNSATSVAPGGRSVDLPSGGTASKMHTSVGSRSGNHSSSSSTASGPVTNSSGVSGGKGMDSTRKGERPKTEDFLTFLCLRGETSSII